jgi:hypothetical protein
MQSPGVVFRRESSQAVDGGQIAGGNAGDSA